MTDADFDAEDYVRRATTTALAGVRNEMEGLGGQLDDVESWQDEDGSWLRVTTSLRSRPDIVIRFARMLLRADGPDKDAELSGMIYSTGLNERILTRLHTATPVDGVVIF